MMFLKKNIILIALITGTILCFSLSSHGAPLLEIKNYSITDFTNKQVVLFKKGDNPAYSKSGLNDTDWKRISLPSNWNSIYPGYTGICWYRIHITFPREVPRQSVAIRLGVIIDTDQVYFNNKRIGQSGEFPPNKKSSYDKIRIYEIPTGLIRYGKENILAIRVAGLFKHANGPYRDRFKFGYLEDLRKEIFLGELLNLIFIVIYITISFYIGIFFFRNTDAKENIVFSVFTLFSASYFFLRTQMKYLLFNNFIALKKIEYGILILTLVLFMEFVTLFFKRKHTFAHFIFYSITSIYFVIIIITKDILFMDNILRYIIHPSWIIPMIYCLYITIKHLKDDKDAKYLLGAFLVLLFTSLNDVMVSRVLYNFIRLSNYGFLFMIISIIIIMHNRFVRMKDEIEHLKKGKIKSKDRSISSELQEKLDEAISIIKNEFTTDLTRKIIADRIGISPDYLGKIFKKATGKRVSQYINECRVSKAKELLSEDDTSVVNIAFNVGFESLPTFYRIFQQVTGKSPNNYRNEFLKNK